MNLTNTYSAPAAARFQEGLKKLKANERKGALLDFSYADTLGHGEATLYKYILENGMGSPKELLGCKPDLVCTNAIPLLRSVAEVNPEASFTLGKILWEQEKQNPNHKKEGVDFIVGAALKDYEPAFRECCQIVSYALANIKWKLPPDDDASEFSDARKSRYSESECDALVKALAHWEPTKLAATYYLGEALSFENDTAKKKHGRDFIIEAARGNYSNAFASAGKKLLETQFGYGEGCSFLIYAVREFSDEAASNALKDFEKIPGGIGIIEKAGNSLKGFISKLKSPPPPGIKCKT